MPHRTGARRSPAHKLLAATPFRQAGAPPAQVALIPTRLDMWGNDAHGDCVTAEEAFAKACHSPEVFIDTATVEAWARAHGVLEGAYLTEVLDAMVSDGFVVGAQKYDDGGKLGVDYSNQALLQGAIAQGPVKIAIDSTALPSLAGAPSGWTVFGGKPEQFVNTDHCVSLCGYGPTPWLAQQLGSQLPAGAAPFGYLLFTWGSIGIVDHAWLMSTCVEAWLRQPTTVVVPPPTPTPTPGPLFHLTFSRPLARGRTVTFAAPVDIPAGSYGVSRLPQHSAPTATATDE